jgi:hypothetical protein
LEFGDVLGVVGKASSESDFNRVYFTNFRAKDIDFLMDFVAQNSNKLQKLGLEGKIS